MGIWLTVAAISAVILETLMQRDPTKSTIIQATGNITGIETRGIIDGGDSLEGRNSVLHVTRHSIQCLDIS